MAHVVSRFPDLLLAPGNLNGSSYHVSACAFLLDLKDECNVLAWLNEGDTR
jgi:hypothetical protein